MCVLMGGGGLVCVLIGVVGVCVCANRGVGCVCANKG